MIKLTRAQEEHLSNVAWQCVVEYILRTMLADEALKYTNPDDWLRRWVFNGRRVFATEVAEIAADDIAAEQADFVNKQFSHTLEKIYASAMETVRSHQQRI